MDSTKDDNLAIGQAQAPDEITIAESLKNVESLTIKGEPEKLINDFATQPISVEIKTDIVEKVPNNTVSKQDAGEEGMTDDTDINLSQTEEEDLNPKPCNSKSLNGSYESTSGIGSNGTSTSSSNSAATSSSGIKKRSSSSHRRNYRSSQPAVDSENSNENDNSTDTSRQDAVEEMDSGNEDLPLNKYMRSEHAERDQDTGAEEDENPALDNRDEQQEERLLASPQEQSSASTPVAFSDFEEEEDIGGERVRRAFDRFFNNQVDSSSSSSSDFFHDDPEESSSSSSDNYLEDIDEAPPERSRPTSSSEEAANSSQRNPTSSSATNEAKKPKKKMAAEKKELPRVLQKKKPVHNWNAPKELLRREIGLGCKLQPQSAELFRSRFYGSLFSAERLELMKKLDGHSGCVNCLNFNHSGTKLASGSDDLLIKIWDYGVGKCITSFKSGHKANVFQAKFVPLIGLDTMIVSCARDNQVRLTELSSTGSVCSSKKLVQHLGPAHKLSINAQSPHLVLSCGEDGLVFSVDIREEKPERLVKVMEKGKKVGLYSIHQNPLLPYEFCVAGRDQFVRIYDIRKINKVSANTEGESEAASSRASVMKSDEPIKKFCPHHLIESTTKTNVTAAVYNYNGSEILGSYNDENIYLFDAFHSDMADCIKVYEGHRNNATVKGVNFFGDRSQFVVSGSDCGHIFIWDKETESIVNFLRGDENGVINCLENHPTAPILATSGLDNDVKIWIPSREKAPDFGKTLVQTIKKNLKNREDDAKSQPGIDQHMMWAIWNHVTQSQRSRRENRGEGNDEQDSDEDFWNDDGDDDDEDGTRSSDCVIS